MEKNFLQANLRCDKPISHCTNGGPLVMKFRKSLFWLVILVFACFGASTPGLLAQGTDLGTIQGTVTDSGGAVIPNAKVAITNQNTGTVFTFTTNSRGFFTAPAMQPGTYNVEVTQTGFGPTELKGVRLLETATVNLTPVMQVSKTTTTVTVGANAALINTQNQTLNETLGTEAINQLPRNSRDIYQFLYINPNIQASDEPGDFKFLGAQSYGATFSVDGQAANGGIFAQATQSQPSLLAVGSLNVLSSGYDAQYSGIANIRVTTRAGTDQYHGAAEYNNVNSGLAAWTLAEKLDKQTFEPTPFVPTYRRPVSNSNVMAYSFGGPIPKIRKTWFFAAYEQTWQSSPSEISGKTPHPSILAGDFSQISDASKPAVPSNITLTPDEIAADTVGGLGQQFITIPQRLINPVVAKMFDLYFPVISNSAPINPSTGAVSGYSTSVPGTNNQKMGDLRIDHVFNESNRITGVYHVSTQNTATSPVSGTYSGLGLLNTDRFNNMVSLSYTHVFTPSLVNEARGGFNIQHRITKANTTVQGFLQSIGFSDADVAAYGSVVGTQNLSIIGNPVIGLGSNFSTFGTGGRSADRKTDQNLTTFGDTLTWNVGRHTVLFGGDFVRNQAIDGFASSRGTPQGTINYTGKGPTVIANLILGEAPQSARFVPLSRPPMDVHNWENGFFAQDAFKVNPRLTLNFGLRYQLYTPFIDANDLEANFDPNYTDTTTGQRGRYIIPSEKTLQYVSDGFKSVGYVTAANSGLGIGRGLMKTDKNDWGPRAGFAFRLTDRSVLRGGYGIYYPTPAAQIVRDAIATNPFNQSFGATPAPTAPLSPWPVGGETVGVSPNVGGVVTGGNNLPSANWIPTDLKNPRLQNWNVTYEMQVGSASSIRVSYIGAHQSGQILGLDASFLAPNDDPFGTSTDPTGLTGIGDGFTPCDPSGTQGTELPCEYSLADKARQNFPLLGDFITGFQNSGRSNTNSFQTQFQHKSTHFLFSIAYTNQVQNSSGLDLGNSSLAGNAYNMLDPNSDYGPDSWVSRNRVVSYGVYDLPIGRKERYAANVSKLADLLIGGWQLTYNMFAKSGVPFTPFIDCTDCDPVTPGNVGTGAMDAVGDFGPTSIRPLIISDPRKDVPKGYQWNPAAFALPSIGADLFTQANVAKRNALTGPGAWGVNLGVHKIFHATERVDVEIGADIDNLFNHPMRSPDLGYAYATPEDGPSFAGLGSFNLLVDQGAPAPGRQPAILPVDSDYTPNAGNPFGNFGQNYQTFENEGISGNREIRLKGRISF